MSAIYHRRKQLHETTRFPRINTEEQHCTVPQQPDKIRKLGRGMAGQLHVRWGLTGANS